MTMRLPLWLILGLPLLAGCPQERGAGEAGSAAATSDPDLVTAQESAGSVTPPATAAVEYPAPALDYMLASLRQPATAGYPPLERTWVVAARLKQLESVPAAAELRSELLSMVELAGEQVLPQLAAAWLSVAAAPAEAYLVQRIAEGDTTYVNSLMYSRASARRVLEQLELAQLDAGVQLRIVRLLVQWHPATAEFAPVLKALAESPDGNVRLQAIGMLIEHGLADDAQRQELWNALRTEPDMLEAAAEGIRLSGDGSLAEALVPLAAQTVMGELDSEAPKHLPAAYAAYALAYLPGDQAQLMRRKLLGAVDPTIRWEARLGELLHGESTYWDQAVRGTDQQEELNPLETGDLWITLEPRSVVHEDLLPTFELASRGQAFARYRAALQLNRYGAFASNAAVGETLVRLAADSDPLVKATAWYSLGQLAIPTEQTAALALVGDAAESEEVRIAAAYYLLALAEVQRAEVME